MKRWGRGESRGLFSYCGWTNQTQGSPKRFAGFQRGVYNIKDMRLSLRVRLVIPLAILLAGLVAGSVWSAAISSNRAKERVSNQIKEISRTLGNANFPLTRAVLEQTGSLSGAEFAFAPASGPTISTLPRLERSDFPIDRQPTNGDEPIGAKIQVDGREFRVHTIALKEPHHNAGGTLSILYPEELLTIAIDDARRPSYLGLAFGLIALALTLGLGQRLVGRIRDVEKRTRQIAQGHFQPIDLPKPRDEVRDLCSSLNEMAKQLAESREGTRRAERVQLAAQLAAGLAHQLRNSATGAKLAIQVHLDEHPDNGEALRVALRQLDLMESNLRRFIDMSRPQAAAHATFNLVHVIDEVVAMLQPQCRHSQVKLDWRNETGPVSVVGDVDQIRDVFLNLIGNAVEAAGPGGDVRIAVQCAAAAATVEISDSGPGPTEEIAARLFEPFVTGKPEGIGLGLAVARHAATAHGGEISWRRVSQRTAFTVRLPIVN